MEQTALAKSNGNGHQITIEEITENNMKLAREMVVNGRKMSDDQIRGRAAFAAQQGLDVISEVNTLVDKDGRTMGNTMHINGLRRKNQEQLNAVLPGATADTTFIEIAKERMQTDWMYAYECHLRDGVSYHQWQKRLLEIGKTLKEIMGNVDYETLVKACGPAPVSVGVGVVYKSELSEWKDRNFNPVERAKKRAETNARHHRFSTNAPVSEDDSTAIVVIPGNSIDAQFSETPKQIAQPETEKRPVNKTLSELGFAPENDAPLPIPQNVSEPEPATPAQAEPEFAVTPPGFEQPEPATASVEAYALDEQGHPYDEMKTPEVLGHLNSLAKRKNPADAERIAYLRKLLAARQSK